MKKFEKKKTKCIKGTEYLQKKKINVKRDDDERKSKFHDFLWILVRTRLWFFLFCRQITQYSDDLNLPWNFPLEKDQVFQKISRLPRFHN